MRIPSFEECPRLGLVVLGGTVYPSLTCFSTVGKMTTALVSQKLTRNKRPFLSSFPFQKHSARSQERWTRVPGSLSS